MDSCPATFCVLITCLLSVMLQQYVSHGLSLTFCPLIHCFLYVMPQQMVSHGFLSLKILSTNHLSVFCHASTAGKLWIPVLQHSVC